MERGNYRNDDKESVYDKIDGKDEVIGRCRKCHQDVSKKSAVLQTTIEHPERLTLYHAKCWFQV